MMPASTPTASPATAPAACTVLITGFEPFGGEALNPSWEVARALHGARIGAAAVVAVQLPCVFGAALAALDAVLAAHQPRWVLCLGQAGGRCDVSVERVAINVDDARIPDNAGAQPVDQPVVPGAPAGLFSTLPIKAIVAALRSAGLPASVSQTAGTFVCNHLFFGLMHRLQARPGVRGGFIHLPLLPAQAAALPGQPSLGLTQQVQALQVAVQACLAHAGADLALAGGSLH